MTVRDEVKMFSKSGISYMKLIFPIRAKDTNSIVYKIVKFKKSAVILPTILIIGPICSLNWNMENILRIKHTMQIAKMY